MKSPVALLIVHFYLTLNTQSAERTLLRTPAVVLCVLFIASRSNLARSTKKQKCKKQQNWSWSMFQKSVSRYSSWKFIWLDKLIHHRISFSNKLVSLITLWKRYFDKFILLYNYNLTMHNSHHNNCLSSDCSIQCGRPITIYGAANYYLPTNRNNLRSATVQIICNVSTLALFIYL